MPIFTFLGLVFCCFKPQRLDVWCIEDHLGCSLWPRMFLSLPLAPTRGCKPFPRSYVSLLTHLGAYFYVFGARILLFHKPQRLDVWGVEDHLGCSLWSGLFLSLPLAPTRGWKSFPRPYVPLLTHLGTHFYVFGAHIWLYQATEA